MSYPEIGIPYRIILFRESKHLGGIVHIGIYSCGFWHTTDGKLIALHRDARSWEGIS